MLPAVLTRGVAAGRDLPEASSLAVEGSCPAAWALESRAGPFPVLSVIIPAYNEAGTIARVLERVLALPGLELDVIVVDDGSTDGTADVAFRRARTDPRLRVLSHDRNRGKGAAIRTALPHAQGEVVVIQDGDLETDPRDILRLLSLFRRREVQVVYGSRWLCAGGRRLSASLVAAKVLGLLTRILYGGAVTDVATCYKMFRIEVLHSLDLKVDRFSFCPEVTAKVLLAGHTIHEVPISYSPRTVREGKKIRWRDGINAVWTLLNVRLTGRRSLLGGSRTTHRSFSTCSL